MYHKNLDLKYLQSIESKIEDRRRKTAVEGFCLASVFLLTSIASRFSFLLLFLLLPFFLAAQGRDNLETKRKKLLQEIGQTNTRLSKTKKDKKHTFNQYITLQSTVKNREELIILYEGELIATDTAIMRTTDVIESLKDDQQRLKEDYAAMVRHAYRMKLNNNELQFLFASKSFNEAFQRWQYLLQYDRYRKKQARLIEETQLTLQKKRTELEAKKIEKMTLLEEVGLQKDKAGQEMGEMNRLLTKLKGDERALVIQLKKQQKSHRKLNKAIEDVIFEEMARRKRNARTKAGLNSKRDLTKTNKLSSKFAQNKGKLPWPVRKGTIVSYFGRQEHATIKGIKVTNNGIDIRTRKGAKVLAIFDGRVAGVQFITGYQNMVIIQHGNYYTVYSNLTKIAVKRNDIIRKGQVVGYVGTKKPDLHFEVWREKERQNPVRWIKQ